MIDRFVTVKEFNNYKINLERRLTSPKSLKAYGVADVQVIEDDRHLKQFAKRGFRALDYVDATPNRWGTFVYIDTGIVSETIRIFVAMNITYKAPFNCYTYFRLRDGVAGYDQAGTVRSTIWNHIQNAANVDYYPVAIMAFFDIPKDENHRICCDVKASNNAGTVTVFGSNNCGEGACELRGFSVGLV